MGRLSSFKMNDDVSRALELMDSGTPMVVFDLETTGFSATSDRILSFSAVKVVKSDGIPEIREKINLFMNPGFHIPEKASAVNGITDEKVKNCPLEKDAFGKICSFMGKNPFIAGYNSRSFDEKFIAAMYKRNSAEFEPLFHLDVYRMAKEKLSLEKYTLAEVAAELGVNGGLKFHSSMDDVIATYRCFDILRKDYECPDDVVVEAARNNVYVTGANYWTAGNHKIQRVYVQTRPRTSTYYDVYGSAWITDSDEVNLDFIKQSVFEKYAVTTEAELVRLLKAEAGSKNRK